MNRAQIQAYLASIHNQNQQIDVDQVAERVAEKLSAAQQVHQIRRTKVSQVAGVLHNVVANAVKVSSAIAQGRLNPNDPRVLAFWKRSEEIMDEAAENIVDGGEAADTVNAAIMEQAAEDPAATAEVINDILEEVAPEAGTVTAEEVEEAAEKQAHVLLGRADPAFAKVSSNWPAPVQHLINNRALVMIAQAQGR